MHFKAVKLFDITLLHTKRCERLLFFNIIHFVTLLRFVDLDVFLHIVVFVIFSNTELFIFFHYADKY